MVKKKAAAEISSEEPIVEEAEDIADITKPASEGTTTAYFVKFMNELLDLMDLDKKNKKRRKHEEAIAVEEQSGQRARGMYPSYIAQYNHISDIVNCL
jgi:hypothetical protein